jgi:septum formation protein
MLLESLGLAFDVMPSLVVETTVTAEKPRALALELATLKATEVARRAEPPALSLAADTIVVLEDEVLGKPADRADAERMLRALRGVTHQVITAVALAESSGGCVVDARETSVTMRDYSEEEIQAYLDSGEPMDKAGAYAIQGAGAALVERHTGCQCNVVGLPLILALRLLESRMDVSACPVPCTCEPWPHVRPGPPPWVK